MQGTNETIEEAAIGWVIRLRDAGTDDWEAFTSWLEADPAHAAAYEEAALADEAWGELAPSRPLAAPRPAWTGREPPAQRRWASRRSFLGGAVAAALVGLIGYTTLVPGGALEPIETAAGERRTITLADGSRIDLNGASRLMLDPDQPRFARLDQGEALFTVVHDEARPFEVAVGDDLLRDLGTVFNVEWESERLEVGVAEGAVVFNPGGEALELDPGMQLRRTPGGTPEIVRAEPAAITGWRDGRLSFASATVDEVAADLARNLGVPVSAAGGISDRTFTGVIQLDRDPGDPGASVERAARVLGIGAQRSGEGWVLAEGGR